MTQGYTFWLGASAEEADQALVASDQAASRLAPLGFDPSRFMAVVEKHGAAIRLDLLCDLVSALNLRLRVKVIDK